MSFLNFLKNSLASFIRTLSIESLFPLLHFFFFLRSVLLDIVSPLFLFDDFAIPVHLTAISSIVLWAQRLEHRSNFGGTVPKSYSSEADARQKAVRFFRLLRKTDAFLTSLLSYCLVILQINCRITDNSKQTVFILSGRWPGEEEAPGKLSVSVSDT